MRVLQIHWAFPPTTGGVESHVADLSVALARRGCEVTVLTGESAPDDQPGVKVLRTNLLELDRVRVVAARADYQRALYDELDRLARELRPDIVHGHNLHHFAAAPALIIDSLSSIHGFRVHHTFHETWPDLLNDTPVYRGWAGNYAVSRYVRDECAARIGFSPILRPLGIDTTLFKTRRATLSGSGVPVILHPARLLPWKGVHISIRMMAALMERGVDARLVLTDTARIADWDRQLVEYRRDIVELISELGLGDRIELRPVRYRDMPALYEEADVVVYPTVAAEPYGLVPLEAMSSRRPIVASRCGGIPETVVHGVTGVLVPPGNAAALATSVEQLLADPQVAQAMGEAGRRRVEEKFEIGDYIDVLLRNYRVASMAK